MKKKIGKKQKKKKKENKQKKIHAHSANQDKHSAIHIDRWEGLAKRRKNPTNTVCS